jgi:methyl-accepting chemotaxis protein
VQIATATQERSSVAKEINKNLEKISDLAKITSQGAHSTSQASSTIAKQVIDLHTNLNVFLVGAIKFMQKSANLL